MGMAGRGFKERVGISSSFKPTAFAPKQVRVFIS